MRKRNGVILAVIGFIVFFFCMEGWGADWKLDATTETENHYYDTNITRLGNGFIRVWEKSILTDKGRARENVPGKFEGSGLLYLDVI